MPKRLSERFVQNEIIEHLSRNGWGHNLRAKTGKEHGVDIRVRHNRYGRYFLVEVKGDASVRAKYPRSHREVNFNLALGQIVTRMESKGRPGYKYGNKYGIGFPDSFKDIVLRRLPYSVAYKLNLSVFFVDKNKKVTEFDWKKLKELQ